MGCEDGKCVNEIIFRLMKKIYSALSYTVELLFSSLDLVLFLLLLPRLFTPLSR